MPAAERAPPGACFASPRCRWSAARALEELAEPVPGGESTRRLIELSRRLERDTRALKFGE